MRRIRKSVETVESGSSKAEQKVNWLMPIAANVASYYVKRSGSNIFHWLVMQHQQQQQQQLGATATAAGSNMLLVQRLQANQPDQASAAVNVTVCRPTRQSPPTPFLVPPPAHPLYSSTSNSGSKSNCNCSSICKWKMSTKRARIAFPIAIKNIYNANAAKRTVEQSDKSPKRQFDTSTDRRIDCSCQRETERERKRVNNTFCGIRTTHSVLRATPNGPW